MQKMIEPPSVESPPVTEPAQSEPVQHVSFAALVPHLRGAPLSREAARAIYSWLREEPVTDWTSRKARAPNEAAALEREESKQDELVRASAAGFCAAVAVMFDVPPEILDLKTIDGRPVDRATIEWKDLSFVLRSSFSPRGFATAPPRLNDHA